TLDLAGMQFDTLRLRLIKLATRVLELKTQIKIHCRRAPPIKRSSPCSLTVCRVSLPESRGLMPHNRSPPFNLQRQPDADNQPRRRGIDTACPGQHHCNQNVSSSIYALPRYFARA